MTETQTSFEYTEKVNEPIPYKRQIVWRNVFIFLILHLMFAYAFWTVYINPMLKWYHLFLPLMLGRLSCLGVLAGSHRLWSHRSYKAKLPLRILLMILQTMALQNDIYDWCRDHRVHHKHSDTDADPYNATRGFFFSHMGWLMVQKHPEVISKGQSIELSDVWADPVVRFQRRFYIPLVILIWGLLPTYFCQYLTGLSFFDSFLLAVMLRYVISLHYAWLVNSVAHMYGYQMYDKSVEPRENRWITYLTMGEGYHNYHHVFPYDYSASELGFTKSFNLTTAFIDFWATFGLAYDLRKAEENLIEKRVDRTGQIEIKKNFFKWNVLVDYLIGLAFAENFVIISAIIRYIRNGSI